LLDGKSVRGCWVYEHTIGDETIVFRPKYKFGDLYPAKLYRTVEEAKTALVEQFNKHHNVKS